MGKRKSAEVGNPPPRDDPPRIARLWGELERGGSIARVLDEERWANPHSA